MIELDKDLESMNKWALGNDKGFKLNDFKEETLTLPSQPSDGKDTAKKFVGKTRKPESKSMEEEKEKEITKEDEEENFEDEDADEELQIHWLTKEQEEEYKRAFKYFAEANVDEASGDRLVKVDHDEIVTPRDIKKEELVSKAGKNEMMMMAQAEVDMGKGLKTSSFPPGVIQPQPIKFDPKQLADSQLPNTHVHLKKREFLKHSIMRNCEKKEEQREIFVSTWLSLEKKGIDLYEWMDFPQGCPDVQQNPICPEGLASPVMSMDHLPGVMYRHLSIALPEPELHETLVNLPGNRASTCEIKAILVNAMAMNSSSWLAYHLSGLYWRVQGNPRHALDCLRVALTYAPYHYRDIPLISMANVLQQSTYNNDAIMATNAALHVCDTQEVSHFTMALLYANKSEWDDTVMFLQSCLAHSKAGSNKEKVTAKLRSIYCSNLASIKSFYPLSGQISD